MIRVVKLTFKEEFCNDFIEFISKHQEEIKTVARKMYN